MTGRVWRFGDCELDEARRELRVGNTLVDIEIKPYDVLHQLLLHAGEVVTKSELLDSVWPGVAVVEGSLTTAISKLRKLLNDDGGLIVTVPRIGYKLAAPVHSTPLASAEWPHLHLQPGQSIPGREQWRLLRRLDLSPSSEVWLAEHPKTRETRVFKFAPDEVRLKSLKREVTVARLLHESFGERQAFVRVLEWNLGSHPCFIESEYAGPNLVEWADARGGIASIPMDVRLKLFSDIAHAVAAAHAVDVLHKDLKPANILIAASPDDAPHVKIADFGSASLLEPSRLSAFGITNLGFTHHVGGDNDPLTGTVVYLAPEVLAGQSPTAASDVYALGVLLYQLVLGDFRRPFTADWEADIADPLIRGDIAAAASGDPGRRMKTAAELADRVRTLDERRLANEETHQRQRRAEGERLRAATRRRRLMLGAIATSALAVVAVIASQLRTPAVPPRSKTIAVLPFQNGADATLEFLRLALPDEIVTTLSRARGLSVRPFSTIAANEQTAVDVQQVGRAMRADTLITGRFRKVQEQLHVTLEAIDVGNNEVLWRDTVEAPAYSMIATHVQIALTVRGGLVRALGGSLTDPTPEPHNDEAYELYLRSSAIPYDPEPNPQATAMLEHAVALDPNYAPAWISLSRRYYVDAHHGSGDLTMLDRSIDAAERAVALDPNDVTSLATLTTIGVERGDLLGAHRRAADLVRRRPDNVNAQFMMSYVFRYAGLLDESAAHCERAFLIDPQPLNTTLRTCAVVHFVRGGFTHALTYLNLDLETETGKAFRIDSLVREGNIDAALAIGVPQIPQWNAKYTMLFACMRGRPQSEIAQLARAVQPVFDSEENYLSAGHLSYCGQTEAAANMLTRAIEGNYCSYPAMETDALFNALRAHPEYPHIRAAGRECQQRFVAARAFQQG